MWNALSWERRDAWLRSQGWIGASEIPPEAPYSFLSFDGTDPVIDLDFATDHYKVGVNEYDSLADFIAAGWTETAWGGYLDISSLALTSFTMRAEGVTGPTLPDGTTTPVYMCAIDDNDATASDDIAFLGWTSTSKLQASARRNSITTLDGLTAASIAVNSPAIVTGRFETNNFAMSGNMSDPTLDASGANMLGVLRLMVGGRITDNTRVWTGLVNRVTVWNRLLTNGEVQAITRQPTPRLNYAYAGYVSPMAVRDGNYLYMGANHKFGPFATKHLKTTKQLVEYKKLSSDYQQVDDHNPAACIKTPDGAFLWAYTGHGVNARINFRRSATAHPADVASEVQVNTTTLGNAAYAQLRVHQPTGDIYCIFRVGDYEWAYTVSTDDGVTWAAPKVIAQHATVKCYVYAEFAAFDADLLVMIVNENSQLGTAVMRIATWDVVSGDITTGTGVMMNRNTEGDATLGAQMENMSVFAQQAERSASAQGMGRNGEEFVYGMTDTTGAQDFSDYRYCKYKGTGSLYDPANWYVTSVVNSGAGGGTQGRWIGSLCISQQGTTNPRLYVSRHITGFWVIEQWDASNANGTAWAKTAELGRVADTSYGIAFRPRSPKNADDDLPVFWLEGTYQDFDNFDLRIAF